MSKKNRDPRQFKGQFDELARELEHNDGVELEDGTRHAKFKIKSTGAMIIVPRHHYGQGTRVMHSILKLLAAGGITLSIFIGLLWQFIFRA